MGSARQAKKGSCAPEMSDIDNSQRQQISNRALGRRLVVTLPPALSYVLLMGLLVYLAIHLPNNNWDMLGYVGVVESWHTSDIATIHHNTYSSIRTLPQYADLVGEDTRLNAQESYFRRDLAQNSVHFVQQLPFYAIKPLYCIAASALHRAGLSFPKALLLVSVIAYVGVGLLAWLWLGRYQCGWLRAIFAGLLMVSPRITAVSRSATPNALELAIIALGLYLLLEFSQVVAGASLLLIGIWIRPDALIFAGLVFCVLLFLRMIDIAEWVMFCALALLSCGAIHLFAGQYSWDVLFYHSFVSRLVAPADAIVRITPRVYFRTLVWNGGILALHSSLSLVFLTGVAAMLLHRCRSYQYLTGTVLVSVIIHFLLYPDRGDRFYVLAFFFAPLSLVIACVARSPEQLASARLAPSRGDPALP